MVALQRTAFESEEAHPFNVDCLDSIDTNFGTYWVGGGQPWM